MIDEPDFESFWLFWRKTCRQTDGRGKCRKEYYKQLQNGASPEDILLAAHNHVRNTKDLAFVPLAASWLNSEKWMDEAPREREFLEQQHARLSQSQPNVVAMRATPVRPQNHWLNDYEAKKTQESV